MVRQIGKRCQVILLKHISLIRASSKSDMDEYPTNFSAVFSTGLSDSSLLGSVRPRHSALQSRRGLLDLSPAAREAGHSHEEGGHPQEKIPAFRSHQAGRAGLQHGLRVLLLSRERGPVSRRSRPSDERRGSRRNDAPGLRPAHSGRFDRLAGRRADSHGARFLPRRPSSLQVRFGRGKSVGNGLQTNGLLFDEAWADFLRKYQFLVGLSLDGPEHVHDHYRLLAGGQGPGQRPWTRPSFSSTRTSPSTPWSSSTIIRPAFPEEIYRFPQGARPEPHAVHPLRRDRSPGSRPGRAVLRGGRSLREFLMRGLRSLARRISETASRRRSSAISTPSSIAMSTGSRPNATSSRVRQLSRRRAQRRRLRLRFLRRGPLEARQRHERKARPYAELRPAEPNSAGRKPASRPPAGAANGSPSAAAAAPKTGSATRATAGSTISAGPRENSSSTPIRPCGSSPKDGKNDNRSRGRGIEACRDAQKNRR